MNLTQTQFLAEYEAALIASYPWARDDPDKLARFMLQVRLSLTTTRSSWDHTGQAVKDIWAKHGGKGKPTLAKLRALPSPLADATS